MLEVPTKQNIIRLSPFSRARVFTDARMKMLAIALRKVGLGNKASTISSRWNEIPLVANTQPVTEHQYAYPDDLMNEVADLFLNGLRAASFALVSEKDIENNDNSIVGVLNRA